jgi:CBS domain-containing protein
MARARPPRETAAPDPEALARSKRWLSLDARDVMRHPIVTVELSCPLPEVERTLREHDVGGAGVVDTKGRIVGVVSLRDLVGRHADDSAERVGHEGREPAVDADDGPVLTDEWGVPAYDAREGVEAAADVMTGDVLTVPASAGLAEVARVMVKHRVHRVFVEDGGRHVGIVGTLEVLHALAR